MVATKENLRARSSGAKPWGVLANPKVVDLKSETAGHDSAEIRCVECACSIPADARLCAQCGSHQNRWRNEILFASTLVGIGSVTVTAIAFLISIWPGVRSVIAWNDRVEVVELDGLGPIVIANRGDGAVYVSDLRADTGRSHSSGV